MRCRCRHQQILAPRVLALEKDYYAKSIILDALDEYFRHTLEGVPELVDRLRNVDGERLTAINEGDISLKVISHAFTPGRIEVLRRI